MAETGSDTRSGIGARLRAGREKMGLTQLQAAEKLHVDPKVIDNLETERFEALGATVFVRGHLKRYAELIGEQTSELYDLHAAATKAALPDLTKLPKGASDAKPGRLAVPALVVLIGFVMVGIVWWIAKSVGSPDSNGSPKRRGAQPVVIAPEVAQEPAVTAEVPSDAASVASEGATASTATRAVAGGANATPSSGAATARAALATGPNSASAAGPRGTVPVASAGNTAAAATGAAGSAAPATTASAGKPLEVTLRFAADSWVEVYDANGEKLFYDVGSASSSHTVSGTPPFRVHFANAPGVSLDVNGKPAAIPANAVKGDEAQFTISRAGRIVRAPPKADGG